MEPTKSKINKVYRRRRRQSNTIDSVDRISALPDSILGDILSLLPTEEALATSTLSKRWRFLWRTVHNLHFDLYRYLGYDYDVHTDDENKKFVGFVNHVLFHLEPGVLTRFLLDWRTELPESTSYILSQATSWIKTVITRNVRAIYLCLRRYDKFDMPISLFSCDSLRSLRLEWICLSASTAFCLPGLESLYLDAIFFECDEDLEKIIRGCPVLNYLYIFFEENESNLSFFISSTSLRHLELSSCQYPKYLKLDVSSLEHLKLDGEISVTFVQQKLSSPVEAELDNWETIDIGKASFCNSMVDVVNALESAKILTLCTEFMQMLSCGTKRLSADFERLVKFKTSIDCCQWSSLHHFIQHSDNLEVLTVHMFCEDEDDESEHDHTNWTTPVEIPRCISTSLKKVKLKDYYGCENGREMIGYMLKHGSALEDVKIIFDRDITGSMIERVQDICEYPRMSGVCKLECFTWDGRRVVAPSG